MSRAYSWMANPPAKRQRLSHEPDAAGKPPPQSNLVAAGPPSYDSSFQLQPMQSNVYSTSQSFNTTAAQPSLPPISSFHTTQLSTPNESVPSDHTPDMVDIIAALDEQTVRSLLARFATLYPTIGDPVRAKYDQVTHSERIRVINFNAQTDQVDHLLNKKHDTLSGSKQYDLSGEVSSAIEDIIHGIAKSVYHNSSFDTKRNALDLLMSIGLSVCESSGVIPKEVRKSFYGTSGVEEAMLDVGRKMTPEERARSMSLSDLKESFDRVAGAADGAGCFEGLDEVGQLLGVR